MKTRPFLVLAVALFAVPLAASVALQSCSNPSNAGADANPYGNATPCTDGTIQVLSCLQATEGGVPLETFSDEACIGLDTAETHSGVAHDDAQSPAIDQPAEGAMLPSATPFIFTWHPQGLSLGPVRSPARALTFRDELPRWTSLVPAAEAHCPPFTGVGYSLTFRADGQVLLRAATANTSYRPTASAWSRLLAARSTVTFTVEAARFGGNVVTAGPVDQANPRHFTLSP